MSDLVERACFRAGAVSIWYVDGVLQTHPHISTDAIQAAVQEIEAKDAASAYAEARKAAYLAAWPIERQLEAHAEAAMGRGDLLEEMLDDMEQIRADHPKP